MCSLSVFVSCTIFSDISFLVECSSTKKKKTTFGYRIHTVNRSFCICHLYLVPRYLLLGSVFCLLGFFLCVCFLLASVYISSFVWNTIFVLLILLIKKKQCIILGNNILLVWREKFSKNSAGFIDGAMTVVFLLSVFHSQLIDSNEIIDSLLK